MGCTAAGAAGGATLYPIVINHLVPKIGFGGAVRVRESRAVFSLHLELTLTASISSRIYSMRPSYCRQHYHATPCTTTQEARPRLTPDRNVPATAFVVVDLRRICDGNARPLRSR